MKKYDFKPYSSIFPKLFANEKKRIEEALNTLRSLFVVEHVGSTAIPGLGGKGIIDIAIAIDKEYLEVVSEQIQKIGYQFHPNFSTPTRLFFKRQLSDEEEEHRVYHLHLIFPKSREWKELVDFRNYLKTHPEDVREYEEIKKRAVLESNNQGAIYRKLKEPLFRKIADKIGL